MPRADAEQIDNPALLIQHQLVQSLLSAACYPHAVSHLQLIETHISFVLLTGDFAYKIKKAVNLGFVDYSTLEMRRYFCDEELRLNRRLAPRLYLETVAIGGEVWHPQFNPAEAAIEYAVRMRQFDQRELLEQVLLSGRLDAGVVDDLSIRLAHFHLAAPQVTPTGDLGSLDAIWRPVEDNFIFFAQNAWASDSRVDALHAWCIEENARLAEIFARRLQAGCVRECHGDLHLGNIVLHDGAPLVFDCIEFNPQLRWIDIFNDLAFLFMDLCIHERSDHAWRLLNIWLDITGDHAGLATLRFYCAYRALVRAKVAALRSMGSGLSATERAGIERRRLACLDYACRIFAQPLVALIAMHGLSGSGKSHHARILATELGAICLRSDIERKRLHGLAPLTRTHAGIKEGIYTSSSTRATYDSLRTRAGLVLSAGYPVIIDAANLQQWQRHLWQETAREHGVPFLLLDCSADEALLQKRLALRQKSGSDASDADIAVLRQQQASCDPLCADELAIALVVDRSTEDGLVQEIRCRLARGARG